MSIGSWIGITTAEPLLGTVDFYSKIAVTTQVLKTTIEGLHYAGTTEDMGAIVTKPGI